MTEREAAKIANGLYRIWDNSSYEDRKAMRVEMGKALDLLSPFMSEAQLNKYNDWAYEVRHNRHMYS